MTCTICQLVEQKSLTVFENEKVAALVHPQAVVPGHLIIVPKQHIPILEQVPDTVAGELFLRANQLSRVLVESANAAGTNVLLQNGIPAGQSQNHTLVHVIPRAEKDGLVLAWKPRQLGEEEFSTIELKLKEETKVVGQFEKEPQKPIELKEPEKVVATAESDYRIKHLRRIP